MRVKPATASPGERAKDAEFIGVGFAETEALSEAAMRDEVAEDAECREAQVNVDMHGQRLDRLLVELAPEFSRSHLQSLIEAGLVQVDGQPAKAASQRAQLGQRIRLELRPTAQSQAFQPEAMPLAIRFEDEHLLVIDKPAGLVVHPAAGHWQGTLLNGLLAHHRQAAGLPRGGIVHRLDKDTSGLMVVAKSLPAHTALVRSIAAREVRREYLALAQPRPHGRVPAGLPRWARPEGGAVLPPPQVEAPIARDPNSRLRMAVMAAGKPARTDVLCLAESPAALALQCRLHSGRTHQIRVHLAYTGFPLLADALYGGAPGLGMQRQALHAQRLAFGHPVSGRSLAFEQPPPADFADAWGRVTGKAFQA
jgi:23S rRNA pseudouridine1911/1915/1917 synthase